MTEPYNERELPDDYPMYPGYLYVINGKVWRCPESLTPSAIRQRCPDFTSITNCDLKARDLYHLAV